MPTTSSGHPMAAVMMGKAAKAFPMMIVKAAIPWRRRDRKKPRMLRYHVLCDRANLRTDTSLRKE